MPKDTPPLPPSYEESQADSRSPESLYTNNLSLPWRYPRGYYCKKCNNSGYKLKNSKPCSTCWSKFEPKKRPSPVPPKPAPMSPPPQTNVFYPPPAPSPIPPVIPVSGVPLQYFPNQPQPYILPPRMVQPGDPAIGGILCYKCNGDGYRYNFFLERETCPKCGGIGRVNNY
ncbi:hypothetical protein PP7435_CHR1-0586 [Komagataella phaffii CBS 7435]|uniref:Proline-rich protein n=1 Tax=Komagataella phaffii (strain ATCC 76273 / CBS 7435 / CECT 11047 / NRRL Y-11430 / Wegner 21-1) TaxID=981350 RepID=F2QNZ3_KOMPC|nr:GQ67_02852T0 [Komagataella phaffii]AOA65960.1 GQ68_02395T0 [Komagataella phaffii GS115]CAH2446367.1 hypothetical protein BQ9382_C1-3016 [Komagataella phaffii CBS 7435]CCA36735.1 hypothetical protein PP7435_CHR1-0586 [Komagataella phaffii CBS 7435]